MPTPTRRWRPDPFDHERPFNRDDYDPKACVVKGKYGGQYTFQNARLAREAEAAIAARGDSECPRILGCACGGGCYQKKWGDTCYCQKCGGLM